MYMGRSERKRVVRPASCGHVSKATSISGHSIVKHNDNGNGRNPFFRFLAHFRKCFRAWLYHLPLGQVTLMASRVWNCMSPEEKKPFIAAARRFNYTFRSRSKQVNWVLGKLRESAAGAECQTKALWILMRGIKSWEQCVLNGFLDVHNN
ncbi:uncharacterized protein LOC108029609 [Drosophila biarmipes]|uniref:uncharacterized protein LOC108029609 n=1 Tax=Drosophila biarmipes TaxID=125945 RepID=UPI0007E78725|nr:uncharacterized protein LOC108029609 [Drosophila biarmipes]